MIVEVIVITVASILTTIITKMMMKACHIESKCSECCDVVLETEPKNDSE